MVLDTYTFVLLPRSMTILRPDRSCSHVLTYEGVAFFSWGTSIEGKIIELGWNVMTDTQFDALDAIYTADEEVVWDPTDIVGSSTYNVQVIGNDGEYIPGMIGYRQNCTLTLLIMSEVT